MAGRDKTARIIAHLYDDLLEDIYIYIYMRGSKSVDYVFKLAAVYD